MDDRDLIATDRGTSGGTGLGSWSPVDGSDEVLAGDNSDADVEIEHWYDALPSGFSERERAHTTLLTSGLTMAQDRFISAGLNGLGYKVQVLDCPDNEALNLGKEFGNRGQCNPTYFTVGNLIKFLSRLRDVEKIPVEEIVSSYVFVTSSTCGPCRFGMYSTEYRKALRDAGFEGFRLILLKQAQGLKQEGESDGLTFNLPFFLKFFQAVIAGDVLNALGYRIRPYELESGATDAALDFCQKHVCKALAENRSILRALWRCRKELRKIRVDRSQPKPRVSIIGEFWAMTTEGEGNYKLQEFLESEGAEVDIQLASSWVLFLIWEVRYEVARRQYLKDLDGGRRGLEGVDAWKLQLLLWMADKVFRLFFQTLAVTTGLGKYQLPDMAELADVAQPYYDNSLRGGEGHMEVAKVILNVIRNKVSMTVSVKPFGCMPSSGVSDGVQSLIMERLPGTIFVPIETTGDGAVNAHSRIQMQLFKARQKVQKETEEALSAYEISGDELKSYLAEHPKLQRALHRSPHGGGSTNVDLIHEVGKRHRQQVGADL